jgi:hypothetical protein
MIWILFQEGDIDMLSSDHSPSVPDLKLFDEGNFLKAWGGISSLQVGLSFITNSYNCFISTMPIHVKLYWLTSSRCNLVVIQNIVLQCARLEFQRVGLSSLKLEIVIWWTWITGYWRRFKFRIFGSLFMQIFVHKNILITMNILLQVIFQIELKANMKKRRLTNGSSLGLHSCAWKRANLFLVRTSKDSIISCRAITFLAPGEAKDFLMALDNFWPKQTATQTLVVTITGKKKKKKPRQLLGS